MGMIEQLSQWFINTWTAGPWIIRQGLMVLGVLYLATLSLVVIAAVGLLRFILEVLWLTVRISTHGRS